MSIEILGELYGSSTNKTKYPKVVLKTMSFVTIIVLPFPLQHNKFQMKH